MRKLVTIRKVLELLPIKGADFIELAKIGGWQCVVKKGEFKVNDLALYFEIDSFLPIIPEFEFLRKSCYKKMGENKEIEGFRLKTIKLKKQLSQGLLLPFSTFSDMDFTDTKKDYSEELGVIKYEPYISPTMKGEVKGSFPTHIIPKTDQERIQNIPEILQTQGIFEETEKLDGTSGTYYINNGEFGVCSRNLELKDNDNLYWQIAKKYDIENKLKKYGKNIAIQGEIIGPGIQKNLYNLKEYELRVFDIYDIDKQKYFNSDDRIELCIKLELPMVPIIKYLNLNIFSNINKILKYVEGKSSINNEMIREGSVFKSINDPSISFKIINNEFLIHF